MDCTVTAKYYSKYFFKQLMLYCISKNCPNPAAEKNVDAYRVETGKPNSCNNHVYHFHVLKFPNLAFSQF